MLNWRTILSTVILAAFATLAAADEDSSSLAFESEVALPNIEINGAPAVIHTQGLFVTDDHFYVTGRLERAPKRALLLRFRRDDPAKFEFLDITPDANDAAIVLDHPGGFDSDGEAFWIPVAASRPAGPTAVVRVALELDKPLNAWNGDVAFRNDDHIGALAWNPSDKTLHGANWDTKHVYVFAGDGSTIAKTPRGDWLRDIPDWNLAVQDWKFAPDDTFADRGALVASGIDKHPNIDSARAAVIDWIDTVTRTRVDRLQAPKISNYDGHSTREGMALHGGKLYLLPADIGRDARVYRYHLAPRR